MKASFVRDENVVNPPQIPTVRKRRTSGVKKLPLSERP